MKILIISTNNTDIETFTRFNTPVKPIQYQWISLDETTLNLLQKDIDSEIILINPTKDEKFDTEILKHLAASFQKIPWIVFCKKSFEEQALQSIHFAAWDYLIVEELTLENFNKTLKFNLIRVEQVLQLHQSRTDIYEAKDYSNRLLARMSHEIRTPMNAVIGMAEMLRDSDLNSKQRYYVQTILESGNLLVALFNDLLDFAKIEAGRIRIYEKPFNLYDSLRESIASVMQSALDKRIELQYIIDPELSLMVIGDDLRLRQIVMNLLDNAIKFTQHGAVKLNIKKCISSDDAFLCISVSDTGPGIKSELIPHLFKPYVQDPENESMNKKGVGLGLAICDHLVKRMNGKISVESVLSQGTTFTITIPYRPEGEVLIHQNKPELKGKKALFIAADYLWDDLFTKYCSNFGMEIEIFHAEKEYPDFGNKLDQFDLLITHLRPSLKMDLKLLDSVREKRDLPLIMVKEREKTNEKMIVLRKDAVILMKPIDYFELGEVMEAVVTDKADSLNTVERHYQLDERMADYHPLDILVAEDNAINQRIIMSVLSRYGYRIKMVANGIEAIESLERRVYDVVLMDIQMPLMDGITATKKIRETLVPECQPFIIALTADALQQSRTEYTSQGMDEVLYKPVQTKALMQLLSTCKRLVRDR